jgi:hypothetical protein
MRKNLPWNSFLRKHKAGTNHSAVNNGHGLPIFLTFLTLGPGGGSFSCPPPYNTGRSLSWLYKENPYAARSRKRRIRTGGGAYVCMTPRRTGCPPHGGVRRARGELSGRHRGDEPVSRRSSLRYGGEDVSHPLPYQGVCGRHAWGDQSVPQEDSCGPQSGTGTSDPIGCKAKRGTMPHELSDNRETGRRV